LYVSLTTQLSLLVLKNGNKFEYDSELSQFMTIKGENTKLQIGSGEGLSPCTVIGKNIH
jgi:hypothetical protein